jgi:hypothetical protein
MSLPTSGEPLSFAQHIKPLFRETDREAMQFAFDLWDHKDASDNAQAILGTLRDGTMPCDAAWPQDRVDVFQRWVDAGTPP